MDTRVPEEETRPPRETHSFSLPETVQSGWGSPHFQDTGVPLPRAVTEAHTPRGQENQGCTNSPRQTPLRRLSLTVSTACRFCETNQGPCKCDYMLSVGNGTHAARSFFPLPSPRQSEWVEVSGGGPRPWGEGLCPFRAPSRPSC